MSNLDDPHYNYKRIAAAEDLVQSNALLDLYISLYKKKYRGEPIFPVSRAHHTQIKDFARNAGDKAHGIMQFYFEMKDEWFIKQAYSLDCLLKNLHRIAAEYSQRTGTAQKLKGKLKIQFHCDACWQEFTLICAPEYDFLNVLVRCEPCTTANKPLKKISKEERRATILKLGSAFPDVPWDTKRKDMIEEIKELL